MVLGVVVLVAVGVTNVVVGELVVANSFEVLVVEDPIEAKVVVFDTVVAEIVVVSGLIFSEKKQYN